MRLGGRMDRLTIKCLVWLTLRKIALRLLPQICVRLSSPRSLLKLRSSGPLVQVPSSPFTALTGMHMLT